MAQSIIIQAVLFGLVMGNFGIDNYAHLGGFAGGYLTSAFLNPMTRERGDHMLIAIACIGATVLSVAASIVLGGPRTEGSQDSTRDGKHEEAISERRRSGA